MIIGYLFHLLAHLAQGDKIAITLYSHTIQMTKYQNHSKLPEINLYFMSTKMIKPIYGNLLQNLVILFIEMKEIFIKTSGVVK